MDENLESYIGVDLVSYFNDLKKLVALEVFVLLMSIYNIDKGPTRLESGNICWIISRELLCAGEILDVKLDILVVVNSYTNKML